MLSKMKDFISEIDIVTSDFGEFVNKNKNFNEELGLGLEDEVKVFFEEIKSEIAVNKKKLMRDHKKVVVFGRVGAGKSAVINAILGHNKILPSSNQATTNGFIEIKRSEDGSNYVVFSTNPDRRENIESLRRVAEFEIDAIEEGSHVDVYLSAQRYPILSDNLVILDTPGIDSYTDMDSMIQMECRESDVIIFVIAASQGFGDTERNFLIKHKFIFTDYKVLVLINFLDVIEEGYAHCTDTLTKKVNDYLRDQLNIEWSSEDGIFLISAKERLKVLKNDTNFLRKDYKARDEAFELFLKTLQELVESRQRTTIKKTITIFDKVSDKIKSYKATMLTSFLAKVQDSLNTLEDFSVKINSEVRSIFKEEYGAFLDFCLEVEKSTQAISTINCRIISFIIELLKKKYISIMNLLRGNQRKEILKKVYFPHYLDLTENIRTNSQSIISLKRKYDFRNSSGNLKDYLQKIRRSLDVYKDVTHETHGCLKLIYDALPMLDEESMKIFEDDTFMSVTQRLLEILWTNLNKEDRNDKAPEERIKLNCVMTNLSIVCHLTDSNTSFVKIMLKSNGALNQLEDIFRKLIEKVVPLSPNEQFLENIIFIYWNLYKSRGKLSREPRLEEMERCFRQDNLNNQIKVAAALCLTMMDNVMSDTSREVGEYLKNLCREDDSREMFGFSKDEIFIGIDAVKKSYKITTTAYAARFVGPVIWVGVAIFLAYITLAPVSKNMFNFGLLLTAAATVLAIYIYQRRYVDNEKFLKTRWTSMEDKLINPYKTFSSNLPTHREEAISAHDEHSKNLEKRLADLQKKWK